jgi:hypothetical protein
MATRDQARRKVDNMSPGLNAANNALGNERRKLILAVNSLPIANAQAYSCPNTYNDGVINACVPTALAEERRRDMRARTEAKEAEKEVYDALQRYQDAYSLWSNLNNSQQLAESELTKDEASIQMLLSSERVQRIGPISTTYDEMNHVFPVVFASLFVLPSGVVVALFTGIMGSVGAVVRSLYEILAPFSDQPAQKQSAIQAFGIRPLLGALAGFIVYFVVSAGAAFLVQPNAVDAAAAVNSLSPPALASLGVFAGLAGEDALKWLITKAAGFFKV